MHDSLHIAFLTKNFQSFYKERTSFKLISCFQSILFPQVDKSIDNSKKYFN